MKKFGLSLAVLLAGAAFGFAQGTTAQAPAEKTDKPAAAKPATKMAKTVKVEGEVVAADLEKKTLTLKAEGSDTTTGVGQLAMYRLKKLKTGDKVIVTYKVDDAGAKTEISFIRMATDAAKPAAPAADAKKN